MTKSDDVSGRVSFVAGKYCLSWPGTWVSMKIKLLGEVLNFLMYGWEGLLLRLEVAEVFIWIVYS